MRYEYKTIPISDIKNLNDYWQHWWIPSISIQDIIILYREIPKEIVKSLTVKTPSTTLNFLLSCQNRAENAREWWDNNSVDIDTLFQFADYWLERSEGWTKYRFEKEKVFDVRKRLRTWIDKPWNKNTGKISDITF